jgi:hypothetical protein
MTLDRAKHVARYGGSGAEPPRSHATVRSAVGNGSIGIGDIVQRSDVEGKNRYVVINIKSPWIYTRRIGGGGTPGIITFPSPSMLRKVS